MKGLAMIHRLRWGVLALLLASQLPAQAQAQAQGSEHRVLTALPALHALTSALADGTGIQVDRLPPGAAVPMEGQAHALARLDARVFERADAVVTLESLWRADPLYAAARRQNLRIVAIDASRSWDAARPGVAVIRVPANDVPWAGGDRAEDAGPSPHVWQNPINAMRMAASIAADLARLSPPDAARIERNLAALEARQRRLKADHGARLAAVPDPRVLSLANEFVYLFSEFGIFVEGSFVKQDIDWTDQDRAALTAFLRARGIRVVVHQWPPDKRIVQAIEDGGARLLVLDAGNPGLLDDPSRGLETLVRSNMDALLAAFAAANSQPSGDGTPPHR